MTRLSTDRSREKMQNAEELRVECSNCRAVITEGTPGARVSHGFCEICFSLQMAKLEIEHPILALPAPNWHTDDDLYARLGEISDAELLVMWRAQRQWFASFYGYDPRDTRRGQNSLGHEGRHFPYQDRVMVGKIAKDNEFFILRELALRFEAMVRARKEAAA